MSTRLLPEILALIDALAEHAAQDYLRARALPHMESGDECTKPAPLPSLDQAA